MTIKSCRGADISKFILSALQLFPVSLFADPLTLRHAVELALQHANGAAIAAAEQQSADANTRQLRDNYLPQFTTGTALGWSYGFPLSLAGSAPSIFNVSAQSALIHPELRSFIRAAQSESAAAGFHSKDQRNQIIQDTVLSYAELEKWEQRLDRLREVYPDVQKMQAAVADRVKEGIDSDLDGIRATFPKRAFACAWPKLWAQPMFSASVSRNSPDFPPAAFKPKTIPFRHFPLPLPMTTHRNRRPIPVLPSSPPSNTPARNSCARKANTARSCRPPTLVRSTLSSLLSTIIRTTTFRSASAL
jgi:hypothetical protein